LESPREWIREDLAIRGLLKIFDNEEEEAILKFGRGGMFPGCKCNASGLLSQTLYFNSKEATVLLFEHPEVVSAP
jgi:hypothetical protein